VKTDGQTPRRPDAQGTDVSLEQVLDRVRARSQGADACLRSETQLSLRFETGRLKENALRQETGLNLRLRAEGRVGFAGTTDLGGSGALDDLVARALASAGQGDPLDLAWPAASALEAVRTFDDAAAGLDVSALAALGRRVVERLQRPGWQVGAAVDRYVEETAFANSAGQAFTYRSTAVSVSAEVTRVKGDDVLMAYDDVTGAGVPDEAQLDAIAALIVTRMERGERVVAPPEGKLPVLFTPSGSACVLLPVRQALSGKTVLQGISPLGEKVGQPTFDAAFDLVDDPLRDGRTASRSADDEGVPSRSLPLVERGVLRAFVYDLETAARAGTTSTGHGRRGTFGKPGISFSNLMVRVGDADEATLLREVGHGLVVEDLIGVGQGNVISGAFSHPVALAYRVDGGEITGRVKDAAVAGNAYDLLKRIRLIGREGKWNGGSRLVPPFVLDAVSVARR
jgi:PmbA protein